VSWSVGDVARMAGTTVRTLHHYDEIGLVQPSGRTVSGYRQYDLSDVERLQQVLAYRAMGLGLDEIAQLMADDGDPVAALARQYERLLQQIDRLTVIADRVRQTMEARRMGIELPPEDLLEVFGDEDPRAHAEEAEERWGQTDAWQESHRRTSSYRKQDWQQMRAEQEAVQQRLADALRAGLPATSTEAMDAAAAHRAHISTWFYDVSPQMHRGLADMYVADERFTATYEKVEPGLAAYVREAIHANADRETS
jgi:DNA-binding transcriptional MerR regulator